MKKLILPIAALFLSPLFAGAQIGSRLFNKGSKVDSAVQKASQLFKSGGTNSAALSTSEIAAGLKQALEVGASNATKQLSAADGFFKDAALKILMPAEAKKLESTLRNLGMGRQVDAAILSMNRAAEDAAATATPIFLNAIKGMTIQDAAGILRGGDFAATTYLQQKTGVSLTEAFRPIIEGSLEKVNATKHWTTVTSAYNKFGKEKVATDLTAYVTEKAMAGIFQQLGAEEQKIRKSPAARTTELLKKVFSK